MREKDLWNNLASSGLFNCNYAMIIGSLVIDKKKCDANILNELERFG